MIPLGSDLADLCLCLKPYNAMEMQITPFARLKHAGFSIGSGKGNGYWGG